MKLFGLLLTLCLVSAFGTAALGQVIVKPADKTVKADGKKVDDEKTDKTEIVKVTGKENDTAMTSTGAGSDRKTTQERYRIGYEDTLEIRVFNQDKLSGQFNVQADGTIRLYRLDPIVAVCKTEDDLGREIAEAYSKNYLRDPYVNVRAVDQKSQSFSVIGSVEKPGTFYVNRKIRLLELLAFAGGPDKDAGQKLIVARTGSLSTCREDVPIRTDEEQQIALIDYKIKDILESKENLWMQPGDIVSVLDADVVYVTGNVNKKQTLKLKEPITLSQAIAASEGVKDATDKSSVKILRRKPDSLDREELVFNLKDIESQKIEDPELEPNDIVAVSKDTKKVILKGILETIKLGIPSLFYRF